MREAKRMERISTSLIRRMFEIVERARKEGRDVVSLTIGEPDFDTPPEIIEYACRAMRAGYTHYTSNFGLEELRELIAEFYGLDARNVMITAGASEALLNASLAFVERGSKVLIPSPSFLSYYTYAKMCEAEVIEVKTHDTSFVPDADEINEIMSRDVSIIFLNYPNNPTGAVMDERNMREIAEIAADYGAIVVSDEIYDRIRYDGSFVTLAGYENVIVVNGFSKSLAMTGWRIGYVVADDSFMDSMLKVHQVNGVCAPAFAQKAVAEAISSGILEKTVKNMVSEFKKRRDYVYSELKKYYDFVKPEGAFYMFIDVGVDCMTFAEKILEFGVAVTPGLPFGSWNETYVRISYATSMENLQKAVARIKAYHEDQRA